MFLPLLHCLLAWISFSPVFVTAVPAERRQIPQPPGVDPFYDPPADFENQAPGTVLRQRRVISSFVGVLPAPVETYQLLYRTTAVNGSAIATATTIFVPVGAMKDRFVAFHTAYDSSAPKCSPSYQYQLGASQDDGIAQAEFLIIQAYLASGYIVSSSDYEGPDAAFPVGQLEGRNALDGIRAVSNFHQTLGLVSSPAVVGVGYSGGSIASAWAASLQPSYAPELNMKGWVAGGVPANLTALSYFIDDTLFSGFLPPAIAGMLKPSTYGAQLQPVVDRIATAKGKATIQFADENCAPADLGNFAQQSIFSTDYQSLGTGLFYEPTIAKILQENTLGVNASAHPTAPVLLYSASQDEIVPYGPVKQLNGEWCSQGSSVTFSTYAAGGHLTTEILGVPEALSFVKKAFAGQIAPGCTQNTQYGNTLNPIALGADLEPIGFALLELLLDFGQNDANIKKDPTKF